MGKGKKLKKKLKAELFTVPGIDLKGGDLAEYFTMHTTKSGKLVGTKKEKKNMKKCCIHNTYRDRKRMKNLVPHIKKGKRKGYCYCEMCKKDVRVEPYPKSEVSEIVRNMQDLLSHMQLANQAVGGGKNATNYIASMQIGVSKIEGVHSNLSGALLKRDKVKKNKGKKKKNRSTESAFGSWEVRR